MATKSISKEVRIQSKKDAERFASAVEKSAAVALQEPKISKPCEEIRGQKIKEYLHRF
jgi:hypothetical protein